MPQSMALNPGADAADSWSDRLLQSPIDVHVGARVQLRREHIGMSQEWLGRAVGLSLQQVRNVESGATRVRPVELYDMSRVLNVSISFFFGDAPDRA